MSLKKSKCFSKHRAYDEVTTSDSSMFPPHFESLKNICISDAASTSISNKNIVLSEIDKRHNEYSGIKNNNKYESRPIILENYAQESLLLHTPSNNFISIGVNKSDNLEQLHIERENATRSETNSNRNKVPESCKLVTLQNTACETEFVPEYRTKRENLDYTSNIYSRKKLLFSIKPGTSMEAKSTDILMASRDKNTSSLHKSCSIEDNADVNKTIPDENEKDFQRDKMNDVVISNNFSRGLTDDNILSIKIQNQIVNEQHITLSDKRTATKKQEIEEIKNGITVLPAKPTRSLPTNLKASIEDNNKKSKLIKVEYKLTNSMQPFAGGTQSTIDDSNDLKSTGKCTELCTQNVHSIKQQISSVEDTNWKFISEARDENDDLENNAAHRDTSVASEINVEHDEQSQSFAVQNIKRKRGRPKKVIDSTDQITPKSSRDDDMLQEIPKIITESVTHDRRRTSKIMIDTSMSDETDTVEEETIVVKKRGRPPGSTDRNRGRGRGRGRGRSRGRGRGTLQNLVDTEYTPRLTTTNVSQSTTEKSNEIDDTSATSCIV